MTYGKIYCDTWEDEKIEPLSDRALLLWLFILSGPHRNAIGCFRLGVGTISDAQRFSQWDVDQIRSALNEIEAAGLITRDSKTGWTLVNNLLKRDPVRGPKVAVHALGLLTKIPKASPVFEPLLQRLAPQLLEEREGLRHKPGYSILYPFDTLSDRVSDRVSDAPSKGYAIPFRFP